MIIDFVRGDILNAQMRHIAFAVNAEGINDSGFVAQVTQRWWPELRSIGPQKLGITVSREISGRTFHAMVCHNLGPGGWRQSPGLVIKCLDMLPFLRDEDIVGVVAIGQGLVGKMGGADAWEILSGIARSKRRCHVFTL